MKKKRGNTLMSLPMIRQTRGQAAMEFLMTYGWAILAAVIVVGVLWYLLGNPANLAGNQFQVAAPLVAKGLVINTTGITINVLNGAANAITPTAINLTNHGCTEATNSTPSPIAVGKEGNAYIPCTWSAGDRVNGDLIFKYHESGSTFDQSATGSISGQVPG